MKKSYLLLVAILVGALVLVSAARAEETPTTTPNSGVRDAVKKVVAPIKTQIKDIRTNAKTEIKDVRRDAKSAIEAERELIKKRTETAKEDIKARTEELKVRKEEFQDKVREEKKQLEERIKEKRTELKERLEKIKDERKKQVVERIDKSMDELNARMVKHFTEVLDKVEGVLNRVSERTEKAKAAGADVSVVVAAIDQAVNAIREARAAIEAQAGKTYTINVTDEATLKNRVGEARQSLRADLKVVQDAVKAAHEAVRKVAVALGQIIRPSPSPKVSPSPTPLPTESPSPTPVQ
ncbi:MAG: hypothetical protein HYT67_01890 [Candidatus Yanofskybacteria bacterium]|nr:hypothetical protein [Candidatus Yanofskybacteria bacterium]